jgi:hypothetical protein
VAAAAVGGSLVVSGSGSAGTDAVPAPSPSLSGCCGRRGLGAALCGGVTVGVASGTVAVPASALAAGGRYARVKAAERVDGGEHAPRSRLLTVQKPLALRVLHCRGRTPESRADRGRHAVGDLVTCERR